MQIFVREIDAFLQIVSIFQAETGGVSERATEQYSVAQVGEGPVTGKKA